MFLECCVELSRENNLAQIDRVEKLDIVDRVQQKNSDLIMYIMHVGDIAKCCYQAIFHLYHHNNTHHNYICVGIDNL